MGSIGSHDDHRILFYSDGMTGKTAACHQWESKKENPTYCFYARRVSREPEYYKRERCAVGFSQEPDFAALSHREIADQKVQGRQGPLSELCTLDQEG